MSKWYIKLEARERNKGAIMEKSKTLVILMTHEAQHERSRWSIRNDSTLKPNCGVVDSQAERVGTWFCGQWGVLMILGNNISWLKND